MQLDDLRIIADLQPVVMKLIPTPVHTTGPERRGGESQEALRERLRRLRVGLSDGLGSQREHPQPVPCRTFARVLYPCPPP